MEKEGKEGKDVKVVNLSKAKRDRVQSQYGRRKDIGACGHTIRILTEKKHSRSKSHPLFRYRLDGDVHQCRHNKPKYRRRVKVERRRQAHASRQKQQQECARRAERGDAEGVLA